jgi:hypothetical protein
MLLAPDRPGGDAGETILDRAERQAAATREPPSGVRGHADIHEPTVPESLHGQELSLSQLSGTWTGVQYTRATGQCRTDPRQDVELILDVRDDGRIRVTDGRRYVGTGDVSAADWTLTLVDEHAFAMCGGVERPLLLSTARLGGAIGPFSTGSCNVEGA